MPAPMPLGPFLIGQDGKLDLRSVSRSSNFSFLWRGRRFQVRLSAPRLYLAAVIGRIPSSAVSRDDRVAALRLIGPLRQALPRNWTLRLLPDHRIQLELDRDLAWPSTIGQLMAPVIAGLLQAAPFLDFADEAGLAGRAVR